MNFETCLKIHKYISGSLYDETTIRERILLMNFIIVNLVK